MAIKTSFAVWFAGATLAAASLVSGSALAAAPTVPATLTQQGRILDKTGAPVASKVKIVFNVYADATGGTALWTEEQNITLDDGYFSAQLGSVTAIPAGVFDGSVRYLGVTVGADDEMTPREAVTSVPYAMKSAVADVAGVATSAAFTSLTGIPAPCAAGMYLKGYDTTGAAQCAALPALACVTRYTAYTASLTSNNVGCDGTSDYKILVSGGCEASSALSGSHPRMCTAYPVSSGSVGPTATGSVQPQIIIPICLISALDGTWQCDTVAAASIRTYATCCKVL